MESLVIASTSITPEIHFDNTRGYFELSGMSLPEDSFNFYKPVMDWMCNYGQHPAPQTELVFKMEYFNTSSTAYILKLIKEVARMTQKGSQVTVKWYHDYEDDDMSEAGRGLGMLANIPIELIGYQASED
jgi:hypothetical protein